MLLSYRAIVVLSDFSYANARSMWHIHRRFNNLNCQHGSDYDMTDFAPAVNVSSPHCACICNIRRLLGDRGL